VTIAIGFAAGVYSGIVLSLILGVEHGSWDRRLAIVLGLSIGVTTAILTNWLGWLAIHAAFVVASLALSAWFYFRLRV